MTDYSAPQRPHADLMAEARDYAAFSQASRHAPLSATRLIFELCDALAAERARADQADATVKAVEVLSKTWKRDGEQPDLWIALDRALSAAPNITP